MPTEPPLKAKHFVPDTIIVGGVTDKIGKGLNQIQAQFSFEFYNGLNTTVTVITRTGVKYNIPPMGSPSFRGFLVRSLYKVIGGVNVDTYDLWNDTGRATSAEAELIAKAVSRDDSHYRAHVMPHIGVVDYVIQQRDFEDYGGVLYLTNLDITLSFLPKDVRVNHPHSLAGTRLALLEENRELVESKGLTYRIRIIDRLGRFGDRFVNISGEVFSVKAERNGGDLQDGVYAVSTYPTIGSEIDPLSRTQHYSFEEAEKELHLYPSYILAKTLGNPQDVYKRELETRASKQKLEEQKWAEEKQRWQQEADRRKAEFDQETHRRKLELVQEERLAKEREAILSTNEQTLKNLEATLRRDTLVLKEAFENRSMDRRETMEIMKHIPMLLTGVGAIYLAIKKLKG